MQKLEQLIDKNFNETTHGRVANYIPALSIVDPQQLGITVYDIDEEQIGTAGMAGTRFAIESIAKVVTLILAIKRLGHERVLAELESGATDFSLSSVFLDNELNVQTEPVNYLNNSSALLTTALIDQLMGQNSFNALLGFCREICNDPCISLNERLFRSAIMNDKDLHSLAYYLKDKGLLETVDQTLITYFMQSSMMVTTQSLANLGAVLANDGIMPWNNVRLISHEDNELIKKLLTTVGSFEESKEYTIKIGLPIKSGTSGGLLACAPQKCGIGVFSPALDQYGNSVAGMSLLQDVVDQLDLVV
ncbi:glutaminase A [Limosilactobacillus caviae]|uniref:glutaminase A n=1 Tax=Limosilactobacillus caviae TaxID=1769424 RepID=UPI00129B304D|nr:glutaminase A [Limosilactobacillus caviae]MCD7124319.1 glutaminase A [Limosilactobacillus caviae]MRH46813.1 glutaminase A [Limosilactobacillus reuteri]